MCGISFYCSLKGDFPHELDKSLDLIAHRGPDGSGTIKKKIGKYNIGIGHNRLSIIDLSEAGSQPMVSNKGNILSFNGEIYNFKELKAGLDDLGCVFNSCTDTEVLLQLFEAYGIDSFSMLEGMFTFVLLDTENDKFYLVRDSVGIKPVYIYDNSQEIYGCSEIKGLKAFSNVVSEIDNVDLYEFFNQGFLYEPSTGYKFIKKLLPGHCLSIDLKSSRRDIFAFNAGIKISAGDRFESFLIRSIKLQQVSEVPLGLFFSGGMDSSILASHFNSPELFFAKYESDVSADLDLKYSKLIANYLEKKLNISEMSINSDNADTLMDTIDFVAKNTEELISDYTFLATYKLSKAAKSKGYKVMLSGMGGDEVFAGYPRYRIVQYDYLIRKLRYPLKFLLDKKMFPSGLSKRFERLVSYVSENNWGIAYSRLLGYFSRAELSSFFPSYKNLDAQYSKRIDKLLNDFEGPADKVKMAQHLDIKGFLAHNLSVSDKASMLASIELRVPLLSEQLVSYGMQAPPNSLIKRNKLKYPLWNVASRIFPKKLLNRPKTGFNPPLDGLVEKVGRIKIKQELKFLSKIFDLDAIYLIVDRHFEKEQDNTYKIWQLLYFSRWLKAHDKT